MNLSVYIYICMYTYKCIHTPLLRFNKTEFLPYSWAPFCGPGFDPAMDDEQLKNQSQWETRWFSVLSFGRWCSFSIGWFRGSILVRSIFIFRGVTHFLLGLKVMGNPLFFSVMFEGGNSSKTQTSMESEILPTNIFVWTSFLWFVSPKKGGIWSLF